MGYPRQRRGRVRIESTQRHAQVLGGFGAAEQTADRGTQRALSGAAGRGLPSLAQGIKVCGHFPAHCCTLNNPSFP
jgi:hypothetical protein